MTCIQLNEMMPEADKFQDSYYPHPAAFRRQKGILLYTIAMLLCYELEAFTM